jgi:phosphoribosylaminoimidazole-succinocarboxamide synthase
MVVPEKADFPSVDVAVGYVKKAYETENEDDTLIPFSDAVDVIFDYARKINHPLANKGAHNPSSEGNEIEIRCRNAGTTL